MRGCERHPGEHAQRCVARRTYSTTPCNEWRLCTDRRMHMRFVLMTSPQLYGRGPRPLTSPGLVHILATPRPFSPCGMARFGHTFHSDGASVLPSLRTISIVFRMRLDNFMLFAPLFQKTRSCFHNPIHLCRNSLRHYCTFHRKPDFPCLFFSTVFLLHRPHRISIATATTT